MRFLVVGCGSIGERHIMNLKKVAPHSIIDVYDSNCERLEEIKQKYSVIKVEESVLDSNKYDCVLVCTPPVLHIKIAIRALLAGSNVFIEKPLSHNLLNIEKLKTLATRRKLLVFVGYNFRFNKGINTVKQILKECRLGKVIHISAYYGQYLPDWRPWQDYKKSYTARKDLGGGIIHDASHELDYVIWLLGKPASIQSQSALTDILSADTEAVADILLTFKENLLAYIHIDFIRREYRRAFEILCENGIIQWSLSDSAVRLFDASTKRWSVIELREEINDMYLEEMKHFIKCIRDGKKSNAIDIDNGISTLRLSNAVFESSISGKRLSV